MSLPFPPSPPKKERFQKINQAIKTLLLYCIFEILKGEGKESGRRAKNGRGRGKKTFIVNLLLLLSWPLFKFFAERNFFKWKG